MCYFELLEGSVVDLCCLRIFVFPLTAFSNGVNSGPDLPQLKLSSAIICILLKLHCVLEGRVGQLEQSINFSLQAQSWM